MKWTMHFREYKCWTPTKPYRDLRSQKANLTSKESSPQESSPWYYVFAKVPTSDYYGRDRR